MTDEKAEELRSTIVQCVTALLEAQIVATGDSVSDFSRAKRIRSLITRLPAP